MTIDDISKNTTAQNHNTVNMDQIPDLDGLYASQSFAPPPSPDPAELETVSNLLGKAWEKINEGQLQKAADIFEMALFEARKALTQESIELADFITDLGSGLFLCGEDNYEPAAQLIREAIEIRSKVTGEANVQLGRLYRQLASMLQTEKKYTESVAAMRKTIDIFEVMKSLGASFEEGELAKMYKDLAAVLRLEDAAAQETGENQEDPRSLRGCTHVHDDDE